MKRAFTLIELLVVIAIIAILAAILFPVFAQAKEAAKKTQALSNLKQIALGEVMYTNDYDDYCPRQQQEDSPNALHVIEWSGAIYPYIKNGTVSGGTGNYAGANAGGQGSLFSDPDFPVAKQWNQYGPHGGMFPECMTWDSPCLPSRAMTLVDAPADKVMFALKGGNGPTQGSSWTDFLTDEWYYTSTGVTASGNTNDDVALNHDPVTFVGGDCDAPDAQAWVWQTCGLYPRYLHTGSSVFAFFDGHAKTLKKGQMNFAKNIFISGVSNGGSALY